MADFNLPPGVSVGDIPGNRSEDAIYEAWLETVDPVGIAEAIVELITDGVEISQFDRESLTHSFERGLARVNTDTLAGIGAKLLCNDSFERFKEDEETYNAPRYRNT